MDKELLRVVIIATGLLVILVMLTWHYLKNRKLTGHDSLFMESSLDDKIGDNIGIDVEYGDHEAGPKASQRYDGHEEPPVVNPMFSDFEELLDSYPDDNEIAEGEQPTPRFSVPEIIQFSLVAKNEQGFNGLDLLNAFQIAHLEYGNLKIFERLDPNRLVDFGVACMVDSGTFPETGMDSFYCPGLVFFMQPSVIDEPGEVFDDFVDTIKLLAIELDGEALDHERQPLTEETIKMFRQCL